MNTSQETTNISIHQQISDLYNSLSFEDRRDKAGIGYSLAQLTTIIQIRQRNKNSWKKQDRELLDWQNNIERCIYNNYLKGKQ